MKFLSFEKFLVFHSTKVYFTIIFAMIFTDDSQIPKVKTIVNNYRLDYLIVNTCSSVIFNARDITTGDQKVLKFIKRFNGKEQRIKNEIDIMSNCKHPNIVQIKEDFSYMQFHVLVLDFTPFRCLYTFIHGQYSQGLPEKTAKIMFYQLLDGLNYLHSQGIGHIDIKTGNFLVKNGDLDNPVVQLTDFGYAQSLPEGKLSSEFIGTPVYSAPEMYTKTKYSKAVDMWSMGVCLYEMLSGQMPWPSSSKKETLISILLGKFNFDSPAWSTISEEAKDLIKQLICVNPRKRLTAKEAMNHPWFKDVYNGSWGHFNQSN